MRWLRWLVPLVLVSAACGGSGVSKQTACETAADCDDHDACTTDTCGADGCEHAAISPDDGDACTTDACDSSTGAVTHTPVMTDDGDACTTDACDSSTGMVTHTPVAIDDGNACTTDACDSTTGAITHTPVAIDDSVTCTDDACDSATGAITHTPNSALCSDLDHATCTVPTCDPTATGADPTTGCVEVPTDLVCDDGQMCTTDACMPSGMGADATTGCVYVADNSKCSDGVTCTDDVCTPFTGCSTAPDDNQCTAGNYCDPTTDCTPRSHLVINEIDYDNISTDNNEWVEIYNGTGAPVDLTNLALVFVNGSLTPPAEYLRVTLTGAAPGDMLPDGGYLVVASNTVTVDPAAFVIRFAGASNVIQNGSPDGVALVDTQKNVVVDALAYEESATPVMTACSITGLPYLANLVEGSPSTIADSNSIDASLIRSPNGQQTNDAAADWAFTVQPTPGTANVLSTLTIQSISPDNGLATASSAVTIKGTDFVAGATVKFGANTATCTLVDASTLTCTVPSNAGTAARVDVTVAQTGYPTATAAAAWTYTGVVSDADFCNVQFPKELTTAGGNPAQVGTPVTIFGQVYEAGLTDASSSPAAGITGDFGISAVDATGTAADPTADTTWTYFPAAPNPGFDFSQNNDEYMFAFTPVTAGTYRYVYRFSLDGGLNYTYCDQDDTNNGFDAAQASQMDVNP